MGEEVAHGVGKCVAPVMILLVGVVILGMCIPWQRRMALLRVLLFAPFRRRVLRLVRRIQVPTERHSFLVKLFWLRGVHQHLVIMIFGILEEVDVFQLGRWWRRERR
ncbi:hypothetical protein H257_07982 [Aphanomyces astaci]|uniref:Uncharacterized protein n=1 Tax=Aphanomyces astaci TaxID=112090 RepID=W4GFJ7_APHAT|nr:hypothetical protein H257_07982 [Aphanomyces astaci]ETV78445.1 hypothetical protein H257_07982 [Aphanomyces astaci]|eukprot:XP_009832026.1 hypothetical protein H257_07982 [Aphanomyces astaci]